MNTDIGSILGAEVEQAFTDYLLATERFSAALSVEDLERLRTLARARRDAVQALGFAVGRLHDYLITGIVPPDLDGEGGKPH